MEGDPKLWREHSNGISVWHFGPGHHAEPAVPGTQTLQHHPFLQLYYVVDGLLDSNYNKDLPLVS